MDLGLDRSDNRSGAGCYGYGFEEVSHAAQKFQMQHLWSSSSQEISCRRAVREAHDLAEAAS